MTIDEWLDKHRRVDDFYVRFIVPVRRFPRQALRFIPDWRYAHTFKPGVYYEDCAYRVLVLEKRSDEVLYGRSLLDGKTYCCDIYHCGPEIISKEQAAERTKQ